MTRYSTGPQMVFRKEPGGSYVVASWSFDLKKWVPHAHEATAAETAVIQGAEASVGEGYTLARLLEEASIPATEEGA